MENIKKQIENTLNNIDGLELSHETVEELVHRVSVYHEELSFQNDELKVINEKLSESNIKFQTIFAKAPIPYFITDLYGDCLEDNELVHLQFGATLKESGIAKFINEDYQDKFYFLMKSFREKDVTNQSLTLRFNIREEYEYQKVYVSRITVKNEKLLLWTLINITPEMKNLLRIESLTYKDQLTGTYNRRFFQEELERLDIERNLPLGIILADVNGLKIANDAFGHEEGDKLLQLVAKTIKNLCRGDEIVARIGGDEFIILIPKISERDIKKLFQRIKIGTSSISINNYVTSVSVGYSIKKQVLQNIRTIEKEAEDMMYHQKLFMHSSQHKKVIDGILATLHEKHPREELHSNRVCDYMIKMGKALNLHESKIMELKSIGLLHDIGKIAIDYSILDKPGHLSEEEFNEIRKHPEIGYRILKSAGSFQNIMDSVLLHHERLDGTGYPKGLKEDEIPFESKILAICDTYDAMTSDRPYRKALSEEVAKKELKLCSGNHFDSKLVDLFCDII